MLLISRCLSYLLILILMKDLTHPGPQQRQPHLEDAELAHAVSLSLKVRCSFIVLFLVIGTILVLFNMI